MTENKYLLKRTCAKLDSFMHDILELKHESDNKEIYSNILEYACVIQARLINILKLDDNEELLYDDLFDDIDDYMDDEGSIDAMDIII